MELQVGGKIRPDHCEQKCKTSLCRAKRMCQPSDRVTSFHPTTKRSKPLQQKNIKLIRLLKGALCTWTIHLHLHNMLHSVQARAVCVSIFRVSCLWRKIKLSWNEGLTRRTIWKASHISGICLKSRKSTHEQHWKWDFKEYWKVCYNRRISSLLAVGNSMMLPSDVGAASDLCPCIGVLWRTVKLTQVKLNPRQSISY